MSTPSISGARWRKSSYGNDMVNCVEVARAPCGIAVRDSKNLASTREVPATSWSSLLAVIRETH